MTEECCDHHHHHGDEEIYIPSRPRRNRVSPSIRSMVRENQLSPSDFILPLFVTEGKNIKQAIGSMPGQYRYSIDGILKQVEEALKLAVPAVALFPALPAEKKDKTASESANPKGLYPNTISEIKSKFPGVTVVTDVAMDPYSIDGHDGLVENGKINNDATLEILGQMAKIQAEAGADIVAPSDMMDGRVGYIRSVLDEFAFSDVGILSYAAKYASAFYGPFRDALESAPKGSDDIPKDKKTYQMDPANSREALREVMMDVEEGADMVMVKPGLPYLDIIALLKKNVNLPIAAYNVSGEYAMIKAAAQNGWLDEEAAMMESLLCMKRAGADIILSYFALDAARKLQ